jgi:hypothetical protein
LPHFDLGQSRLRRSARLVTVVRASPAHQAGGREKPRRDSGFAAVDAVVALMVLATTLTLVLENAETAKRLASAADESQRARLLGAYLLETPPIRAGVATGQSSGFAWTLDTVASQVASLQQIQLCKRTARLTAATSGRQYAMVTARICPAPGAS